MLDDYSTTTGGDNIRAICRGAKVSPSRFYQWKSGTLSKASKTTKKLEKFLIAKKPPPE